MYKLVDTFNDVVISRHKTLAAAAKADLRHNRAVKRNNGPSSYIPTCCIDPEGNRVDGDEWLRATHPNY
jgi:hypothetical protein